MHFVLDLLVHFLLSSLVENTLCLEGDCLWVRKNTLRSSDQQNYLKGCALLEWFCWVRTPPLTPQNLRVHFLCFPKEKRIYTKFRVFGPFPIYFQYLVNSQTIQVGRILSEKLLWPIQAAYVWLQQHSCNRACLWNSSWWRRSHSQAILNNSWTHSGKSTFTWKIWNNSGQAGKTFWPQQCCLSTELGWPGSTMGLF